MKEIQKCWERYNKPFARKNNNRNRVQEKGVGIERELEENIKARENMNREKEKNEESCDEIAHLARSIEQMQNQIQNMHKVLTEMAQKQQQQSEMIIAI